MYVAASGNLREAQGYYKTIKGFYAHQKYKKEMTRVYG